MRRWILSSLVLLLACASSQPNRNPVGETFPSVSGTSLNGEEWRLPDDVAGAPAILLLGYVQDAQFDIDRWLIGLEMAGVTSTVLELPTVEGLVPGLISGTIDEGMRSGIPEPLWKAVVTVYGDAPELVEFTGNERPRNARVAVLDADGRVVFFRDGGFSAPDLAAMLEFVETGEPRIPGWTPAPVQSR